MRDNSSHAEQRMLAHAMARHKSPKSLNTLPIYTFPQSACWVYQCVCWFTMLNTWKHRTTLKRWKTPYFNPQYFLFYYVPSYHKEGHPVCMLTFTVRDTKQIKLFHIGFSQGISKMTALKATSIALCQSSAWFKVCLLSCFFVHKAGGEVEWELLLPFCVLLTYSKCRTICLSLRSLFHVPLLLLPTVSGKG